MDRSELAAEIERLVATARDGGMGDEEIADTMIEEAVELLDGLDMAREADRLRALRGSQSADLADRGFGV